MTVNLPGVIIKICGVTGVPDALACIRAGANAIGLNLVPQSPRFIDLATARAIVDAVETDLERTRHWAALVVGVVADRSLDELRALRMETGIEWLQLHGSEEPAFVAQCLPHAFKGARVGSKDDAQRADGYPGDILLVDAYKRGQLGGTGTRLDPTWVATIASRRKIMLAGGLTPENVGAAIASVRPHGVDVASGVEFKGEPRKKDLAAVRAFVRAAVRAFKTMDHK